MAIRPSYNVVFEKIRNIPTRQCDCLGETSFNNRIHSFSKAVTTVFSTKVSGLMANWLALWPLVPLSVDASLSMRRDAQCVRKGRTPFGWRHASFTETRSFKAARVIHSDRAQLGMGE
ncbi:hypothetical protein CEXT_766071 [Caerostris extrusa]|uniref:Uncharacterized protein n=1 Tax=Caerostris extrusa TaxID=172846 RepID=A0AAV4NLP6_CAEEX|nr:hypothetical protein CEXT_766071 [Caerostris extrusa]